MSIAHEKLKNCKTMWWDEVTTLMELMKDLPENPVIVNIGTGRGISCIAMLEARPDACIFTVDIGPCELAFKLIRESGLDPNRIIEARGTSAAIGEYFALELDAAYIDGDHHYESVCEDIRVWYPKIKPGGIIIFHDHEPPVYVKDTPVQKQKEAWVAEAVRDSLPADLEVLVHKDRIKAFRKPA